MYRIARPFVAFATAYDRALTAAPLRTKLVTGLSISIIGDRCAQVIAHSHVSAQESPNRFLQLPPSWDNTRTVRQSSWSAVALPIMHFWYQLVSKIQPLWLRVALDQFIYSPPLIAAYFSYLGTLRGHSWQTVQEEVSKKIGPTMLVNWAVWIPACAINFSMVPLHYRVLVANCVGFCYGIFLSFVANDSEVSTA